MTPAARAKVLRFDSHCVAEGCGITAFGGNEYKCRLTANPFRLAALATHPLDRGGQGRYGITFPSHMIILNTVKNLGA